MTRRSPVCVALVRLGLCGFSACSALGLDDLDLGSCTETIRDGEPLARYVDPCAALNEKHGLDLAHDCEVYQCRKGEGCAKRPQDLDGDGVPSAIACASRVDALARDCDDARARVFPAYAGHAAASDTNCDFLDNDCDGATDEDARWTLEVGQSLSAPDRPLSFDYTPLEGAAGLLLATDVVEGARAVSAFAFDGRAFSAVERIVAPGEDGANCGAREKGNDTGALRCSFLEVAAAEVDGQLLTAGIDAAGCAAGRVRLGAEDQVLNGDGRPTPWTWRYAVSRAGPLSGPNAPDEACDVGVSTLAVDLAIVAAGAADTAHSEALVAWWAFDRSTLDMAHLARDQKGTPRALWTDDAQPPLRVRDTSQPPALFARENADESFTFLAAYASTGAACSGIAIACPDTRGDALSASVCGCVGDAEGIRPAFGKPNDTMSSAIALAWRARAGIAFTTLVAPSGERGISTTDVVALASAGEVLRGPAVSQISAPSDVDATLWRWLVVWTEACSGGECLRGAMLEAEGQPIANEAFQLAGFPGSSAMFYTRSDSHAGVALTVLSSDGARITASSARCASD